jgi:hypothetical protein
MQSARQRAEIDRSPVSAFPNAFASGVELPHDRGPRIDGQQADAWFFGAFPTLIERVVGHHRSSRIPVKNGCRNLPSADFARYSISASSDGSTQIPRWAIFLA